MGEEMTQLRYRYSNIGSYDAPCLHVETYTVLRQTPKGVWIDHWAGEKFLNETGEYNGSRYAYPTLPEALEHYMARTRKHLKIMASRIARAEAGLGLASELAKRIGPLNPNGFESAQTRSLLEFL
jgi:hypothetical protein